MKWLLTFTWDYGESSFLYSILWRNIKHRVEVDRSHIQTYILYIWNVKIRGASYVCQGIGYHVRSVWVTFYVPFTRARAYTFAHLCIPIHVSFFIWGSPYFVSYVCKWFNSGYSIFHEKKEIFCSGKFFGKSFLVRNVCLSHLNGYSFDYSVNFYHFFLCLEHFHWGFVFLQIFVIQKCII